MHQPGAELAISRSQVRRPNHYTTETPMCYIRFIVAFGSIALMRDVATETGKRPFIYPGEHCNISARSPIRSEILSVTHRLKHAYTGRGRVNFKRLQPSVLLRMPSHSMAL